MLKYSTYKTTVTSGLLILMCIVLLSFSGCCNKKKSPPARIGNTNTKTPTSVNPKSSGIGKTKQAVSRPLALLQNTGLDFAISANNDNSKVNSNRKGSGFFAEKYVKGIELMSAKKFMDAEKLFDEIGRQTSNKEEASIAKLCIAEIYFRNKSNAMALKVYEEIVKKYPKTQAAENAKAGIEYLSSFSKFEKEYISPDAEDQKRRGY